MLRITNIDFSKIDKEEQKFLLNGCLAACSLQLSDAKKLLTDYFSEKEWYVHEGSHHIAVCNEEFSYDYLLKLVDLSDSGLAIGSIPEYLEEERSKLFPPHE